MLYFFMVAHKAACQALEGLVKGLLEVYENIAEDSYASHANSRPCHPEYEPCSSMLLLYFSISVPLPTLFWNDNDDNNDNSNKVNNSTSETTQAAKERLVNLRLESLTLCQGVSVTNVVSTSVGQRYHCVSHQCYITAC